jgi:carbonic anhydrase
MRPDTADMKRLLLLCPLLMPMAASAADWITITRLPDVTIEFDKDSAIRDGEVARGWDRATHAAEQGGPGSGDVSFRIAKTLVRYDCVRRTVVPLVRVFARADGVEIQRLYLEGAELPQPVVPDTPRENMLAIACKARGPAPAQTSPIKTSVMAADGVAQPPEGAKPKPDKPAAKPAPKPEGDAAKKPEDAAKTDPTKTDAAKADAAKAAPEKAPAKPAAQAADPKAKPAPEKAVVAAKPEAQGKPTEAAKPDAHGKPDKHGAKSDAEKEASDKGDKGEKAEKGDKPVQPVRWTYAGPTGAVNWHKLSPDYALCGHGQRQSPIDIKDGIRVTLDGIKFDYKPSALKVLNNGHTVQVAYDPGSSITVGGTTFELINFHFHRPAEERVNGRPFDMVAHLVHKSKDGAIAEVAVLMMAGDENPFIKNLWNHLPLDVGMEEAPAGVTIDVMQLLPKIRGYFTYMGSMTTPPCSEGVRWIVMRTPVQVSRAQVNVFGRLYENNARPIQPAHARLVKEVH